ncbi:MAG: hypothetical protein ABH846_03290 [Patescibacteria group bacterium]
MQNIEDRLDRLKKELENIKKRNQRVEGDKAWEVSTFRKLLITIITYIIASLVLYMIDVKNFYLGALVPTVGYLLSTLTIPIIKKWWLRRK